MRAVCPQEGLVPAACTFVRARSDWACCHEGSLLSERPASLATAREKSGSALTTMAQHNTGLHGLFEVVQCTFMYKRCQNVGIYGCNIYCTCNGRRAIWHVTKV